MDRRVADSRFRVSGGAEGTVEFTYEYHRTRELRPPVIPLFVRHPRRYREHLFDDLPLEFRWEAERRYWLYCEKWKGNLPGWRRPLLIGQARRWALTSREERSQWGHMMLAKRDGYAVQQLYREQGRIGKQHPAHKAAKISVEHRRKLKKKREEEQPPPGFSLPPKLRHKVLPVG